MNSADLQPVLVVWGIFSAVTFIVWTISTNGRRKSVAQTHAEMQLKLLEKLGAHQELADFLKTDAGQKLLQPQEIVTKTPQSRILGSIQAGLVLTLTGMAFLALANWIADTHDPFTVMGVLLMAVGLGFLISSAISYTLSKSWGLLNGNGQPTAR